MFKGREVFEEDTPDSIGMKPGDNVDVYERLHYLVKFFNATNINCCSFFGI